MQNSEEIQVPSVLVTKVIKFALHMQVDIKQFADALEFDPSPATIHHQSISLEQFTDMIAKFMQENTIECLGLRFGKSFAFEYLPEMETFLATADTLVEALKVFEWAGPLLIPFISFDVIKEDELWGLQINLHPSVPEQVKPVFTEAVISVIYKFGRLLLAEEFNPKRLEFQHPMQGSQACYDKFLNTPVITNAAQNILWIDPDLLARSLPNHIPSLHQQATQLLQDRLESIHPPDTLSRKIYQLIHTDEEYLHADIHVFADSYGMTVRTLQRQLKAEGVVFREVAEQAKLSLACQWLRETNKSIETVSEQLGFSDRRSFTRSFVRCAGITPSAYRKKHS